MRKIWLVLLTVLCSAGMGHVQPVFAQGADFEIFLPNVSPQNGFMAESALTDPTRFWAGGNLQFQHRPVVLRDDAGEILRVVVPYRLQMRGFFAFTPQKRLRFLSVGADLPISLVQSATLDATAEPSAQGFVVNDLIVRAKATAFKSPRFSIAGTLWLKFGIGLSDSFGGGSGPANIGFGALSEYDLSKDLSKRWLARLNVLFAQRNDSTDLGFGASESGHQVLWRASVIHQLKESFSLFGELAGYFDLGDTRGGSFPMEVYFGSQISVAKWVLSPGASVGVLTGYGIPTSRILLSAWWGSVKPPEPVQYEPAYDGPYSQVLILLSDESNKPVSNATITVYDERKIKLDTSSDEFGTSLTTVASGTITGTVSAPGYEDLDVSFTVRAGVLNEQAIVMTKAPLAFGQEAPVEEPELVRIKVELIDSQSTKPVSNASFFFSSLGVTETFDGRDIKLVAIPGESLPFEVVASGYDPLIDSLNVVEDQKFTFPLTPKTFDDVKLVGEKIEILKKVQFEAGASNIKIRSFALLDSVAETAVRVFNDPNVMIRIVGHTDSTGRRSTNKRLSQERAEEVMAYLEYRGVDRARMIAEGRGPDQPIATNSTAEGRAKNRRVEFIIEDITKAEREE